MVVGEQAGLEAEFAVVDFGHRRVPIGEFGQDGERAEGFFAIGVAGVIDALEQRGFEHVAGAAAADQQGRAQRQQARPVEAEGDAQHRRQQAERQAGHDPVSEAFGQRRQFERPRRQQQQVERTRPAMDALGQMEAERRLLPLLHRLTRRLLAP